MAAPTAQMPIVGSPASQRMLKALEANSMYEASLELPAMADELLHTMTASAPHFHIYKTVQNMTADPSSGDKWNVLMLLNLLSPGALRSILQNTVAFDARNETDQVWYAKPPLADNAQGVYVIGLERRGEAGEFLSLDEMETLVDGVEDYIAGCRLLTQPSLSDADKELVAWVKQVEEVRGIKNDSAQREPMFASSGNEALLASYKKRLATLKQLDSDGHVRMRQSPLCVGCSTNLKNRLEQYNSLESINKPLLLTISVLEASGIPVDIVSRVAMRVWKPGQLPIAEQLVTMLAGSLVHQAGFNAVESGCKTTSGPTDWNASADTALAKTPFFAKNLEDMQREMADRREFLRTLGKVHLEARTLRDLVDACQADYAMTLTLRAMPAQDCIYRLKKAVAEREAEIRGLRMRVALLSMVFPQVLDLDASDVD